MHQLILTHPDKVEKHPNGHLLIRKQKTPLDPIQGELVTLFYTGRLRRPDHVRVLEVSPLNRDEILLHCKLYYPNGDE